MTRRYSDDKFYIWVVVFCRLVNFLPSGVDVSSLHYVVSASYNILFGWLSGIAYYMGSAAAPASLCKNGISAEHRARSMRLRIYRRIKILTGPE